MLTPSRQGYLRHLRYVMELSPIDEAHSQQFERPFETEVVSRLFSAGMKHLFKALHHLEGVKGIRLYLNNLECSDVKRESNSELPRRDSQLGSYRYFRTRVNLLDVDALPQLSCVSYLSFTPWFRPANAGVQLQLAAQMKGLQEIRLAFYNFEMRYPSTLRDDRSDPAAALRRNVEKTTAVLIARTEMDMDGGVAIQTLPMPNLTYSLGYDVLGSSLRIWSQRLTNFEVNGVFDGAPFWPQSSETTTSPPEWHNLIIFKVQLERHTPSGWWDFMPKGKPAYGTLPRNPAEDADDYPPSFTDEPPEDGGEDPYDLEAEEYWDRQRIDDVPSQDKLTRNIPNDDVMQLLFGAWTLALQRMPSLKGAKLTFNVHIPNSQTEDEDDLLMVDWEVVYEAPDFTHHHWEGELLEEEQRCRRIIFTTQAMAAEPGDYGSVTTRWRGGSSWY